MCDRRDRVRTIGRARILRGHTSPRVGAHTNHCICNNTGTRARVIDCTADRTRTITSTSNSTAASTSNLHTIIKIMCTSNVLP